MAMPEGSNALARLTTLWVGDWHGDETLYPSAWDPLGGPARGTWTVRPGADGCCLVVDYAEARGGRVGYRGHGVHGWDRATAGLYAYWFDSLGVMPMAAVPARFDDDRYTYTEVGPRGHTRFSYAWPDGAFTFTIERSNDGATWTPMHDGRYQRG